MSSMSDGRVPCGHVMLLVLKCQFREDGRTCRKKSERKKRDVMPRNVSYRSAGERDGQISWLNKCLDIV